MPNDCLCYVRNLEIVYCPLHEAAPELQKENTALREQLARASVAAVEGDWRANGCLIFERDEELGEVVIATASTAKYAARIANDHNAAASFPAPAEPLQPTGEQK